MTLLAEKALIAIQTLLVVEAPLNAFMQRTLHKSICFFYVLISGLGSDRVCAVTLEEVLLAMETFLQKYLAFEGTGWIEWIHVIRAKATLALAIKIDYLV